MFIPTILSIPTILYEARVEDILSATARVAIVSGTFEPIHHLLGRIVLRGAFELARKLCRRREGFGSGLQEILNKASVGRSKKF